MTEPMRYSRRFGPGPTQSVLAIEGEAKPHAGMAGMGRGVLFATVAYVVWGLVPVYWKELRGYPAVELIGHRVLWSLVLALVLIRLRGRWGDFRAAWRDPRSLALHALAGVLLASNWLAFVWAVLHDRILDTSLGYYIYPLVTVVLATFFLGERLRRWQWVAVSLAVLGVGFMIWRVGSVPVPALVVAFSWSGYALIKKRTKLGSISGLGLETALLAPLVVVWMGWQARAGTLGWDLGWGNWQGNLWLLSTGLVTIVPLLCFAEAAKTLRLSSLGLFQYAVPSLTFLLAVFWYQEPFSGVQLVAFGAIWLALALYSYDQWQHRPSRVSR
jgi:chloramphenicol-sensitive protein RarD